jgi:N-acetylglucosaminyl-diphospho-decaprenol L-rhamnosyltransferase
MKELDVAVAIVSYKSAGLTIDCLRSIEPERLTPGVRVRAIIVDNASGDATAIGEAIAANSWSSWVTLIQARQNGGFAYGNNLAIQEAYRECPPDYVYLLNPDTVLRHGAISALTRFLEDHAEVGIAGSSFENFDGTDWPIAFKFPSMLSELEGGLQLGLATRLLQSWTVPVQMGKIAQPIDWVPGASMMIRRSVIDMIGGFDEGYFLYFEETEFCLRAKRAGFSTWYVPESRVMHIAGQSTKVTERGAAPKRLPPYWFESRRRYFVTAYGVRYAVAVDIIAIVAHTLGGFKRVLLQRTDRGVPHFLADFLRYSVVRPKNRNVAVFQHAAPRKVYATGVEPVGHGNPEGFERVRGRISR